MFIVDLLHCFLRITDKLMGLFMKDLINQDNIQTSTKYNPVIHKNIKKFSDFCQTNCKMNQIEKDKTHVELLQYVDGWMGPKKRLFFKNITASPVREIRPPSVRDVRSSQVINLKTLFPHMTNIEKVYNLWKLYWDIDNRILRSKERNYSANFVKVKTTQFLNEFSGLYHNEEITPYIHFFCFHLPEQYEKFGNLNYFTTQGLEKLNDFSTHQFFSSTNKKESFIKQMLEKDFRIALLENSFEF